MSGLLDRIAVYTGSFDPVTLGHMNVIERGCLLFPQLIVGVGLNVEKASLFTQAERVALLQRVTEGFPNVEVRAFDGLAVDFVRRCGSRIMLRGIRPLTDFAGEFTMMMANRKLDPHIETIFLMADGELAHVSSSLLKQITPLASDAMLGQFVPREIIPDVRRKLGQVSSSHGAGEPG